MELTAKEIWLLVIGTGLALASLKADDPWVFFPCIGLSWASFVFICASHQGPVVARAVIAVALSCLFVFLSFRIYKPTTPEIPPTASSPQPSPSSTTPPNQDVAELGKRIDKLTDAVTKSPSVDGGAQIELLKSEHDRLTQKRDELSTADKLALDDQNLTLDSLEKDRQRYLADKELERQQEEVDRKQKELEQKRARAAAQEANAANVTAFVAPYLEIIDFATSTLYEMLNKVANESSEPMSSEFRPSTTPSADLDAYAITSGKAALGERVIRVGSNKEWEFHISVAGRGLGVRPREYLGFKIVAGNALVGIDNEYHRQRGPMAGRDPIPQGNTGRLSVSYRSGAEPPYSETVLLSEYRKPIINALGKLIRGRYKEFPLKQLKQPTPTPGTGTSPQ